MLLAESLLGSSSAAAPTFVEDVFSTYLYTGNGSTQTITNGIDLSGKGGLVWIKQRAIDNNHFLAHAPTVRLRSDVTNANVTTSDGVTAFNANGFSIGANGNLNGASDGSIASWTFRKQAKFFDVVTYTGNGTAGRQIAHNLGSVPGCIIVKQTNASSQWAVYHRSVGNASSLYLNSTIASFTADFWNNSTPTSTYFSVPATFPNSSGDTFVAYLFAHDAGGFGATGADNVISCGSFTTDGTSTATINLGWEPQWVLVKVTNASIYNWTLVDNMRGWPNNGGTLTSESGQVLYANTAGAEVGPGSGSAQVGRPFQTGFTWVGDPSDEHIYIAIRRGPMKTPTSGTSVFGLSARTGTGANATVTGGQTNDAILVKNRGSAVGDLLSARLTGTGYLVTSSVLPEVAAGTTILQANPWDVMDGVKLGTTSTITNASANTFINYLFRRAPGFFDVVCYTGTGAVNTLNHNLGVVPEIWILRKRSSGNSTWYVGSGLLGSATDNYLVLNSGGAPYGALTNLWLTPTVTTFGIGSYNPSDAALNASGSTYVSYLFASATGVSKVGSYTGTGTTLQINCGFTGGARFVLIKRTDDSGDWYVWDSARGIVAGNDPYILLNSTAAEVTNTDYIDTYSAGFEISSTAPAAINANGGSFIFLAVA